VSAQHPVWCERCDIWEDAPDIHWSEDSEMTVRAHGLGEDAKVSLATLQYEAKDGSFGPVIAFLDVQFQDEITVEALEEFGAFLSGKAAAMRSFSAPHDVVTVRRGKTDEGRPGYAARCEIPGCGAVTFAGFATRTAARDALHGHEEDDGQ